MAFQSVEHLIDCAQHQPLWQAVLLDDCQDRDVTQEESFARMEALWQAMVESVENYDPQRALPPACPAARARRWPRPRTPCVGRTCSRSSPPP